MKSLIFILIICATLLSCQSSIQNNPGPDINWPGFRGSHANGIANNVSLPATWNIETSENIKWKIAVPGLGLSSPVVWEDRLFITTAVSEDEKAELKTGLYGDVESVEEEMNHAWILMCFDKNSGDLLWERTANTGVPKVKRHPKSSHANCTPATNGEYVIAFFASEGLYCYTMDGTLIWKKDLGVLDAGFFTMPEAQWEFASSPVIHKDRVIVQCDIQKGSFIAAFELKSGKEIWKKLRDEVPTWSTPTVFERDEKTQIVVNGFKHIGGYAFNDGQEIWKMTGGGDIPVPTPVVSDELIFINSAHGKMSPIYAIKTNASGDISLTDKNTSNEYIKWSIRRGGSYMLTPLIYQSYLYNCQWNGALTVYQAQTGELAYKESFSGSAFSASAVAADSKIYFTSEEGEVYVLRPGPEYNLMAKNSLGGQSMATPAISENTIYFRTRQEVIAISEQ